ncbi:MAG: TIGR01777 family oxidoreductase [Caldilineaceae bacterium]|nr:TIGR01777 family oxidoreductase [Caldilineaceae bacterium]
MHTLITGGTGLIGRALIDSLVADGHTATVLTRSPQKHQSSLPAGVTAVKWDGKTTTGWGHLIQGVDAVVNLAGEGIADGRWSEERKQRILQSRVDAGQALVAAIAQAETKPNVLVQASAVGYYGVGDDNPLPESSPPGHDFLGRVCAEWEASSAGVEEMGVRRVVIRTGVVLSTKGGAFPKLVLPFRLFAGGPIGNGRQYFPWIHIDDQVRAIRFLMANEEARGAYNLAAPQPPTNKEFAQKLGKAMGRPALLPVPAFVFKILFGEMSTVLLDGQRAVPQALDAAGFGFSYPEATAATRDILQHKK